MKFAASPKTLGSKPKISFLIPVYNGLNFTKECRRTLAETVSLGDHEIIFIDDASTDGTGEFLATLPDRIIRQPQRSGYAKGMNRAAAMAEGEWLCLLNNDLVFTPGWLEPMLEASRIFPRAGLIGNIQRNPQTGEYDHMGVVFDRRGRPIHFGKYFGFRPFKGYTEWKAVTAACALVKKSVFAEAGGFDESYRNGCEDVDLCLRLWQSGKRHYVANQSVIIHHVSSSEGRHENDRANEKQFHERWSEPLKTLLASKDHRAFAVNYLLRFAAKPWRYNGWKLWNALVTLVRWGH